MSYFKRVTFALMLSMGLSCAVLAELPQISDARVVQPPPGSNVAAAYFTINNERTDPLEITSAASDIARKVEVHLSFVENDVAKMEKQDSVIVGSGESLEFRHGSFHVMFMGLKKELVAGDSLDLVLNTSAGDIAVSVPVISLEDAMSRADMEKDMNTDMNNSSHSGHGTNK